LDTDDTRGGYFDQGPAVGGQLVGEAHLSLEQCHQGWLKVRFFSGELAGRERSHEQCNCPFARWLCAYWPNPEASTHIGIGRHFTKFVRRFLRAKQIWQRHHAE
jgi:hypothetical protein